MTKELQYDDVTVIKRGFRNLDAIFIEACDIVNDRRKAKGATAVMIEDSYVLTDLDYSYVIRVEFYENR